MGLILSKLSGARGYLNYGRGIDSDAQAFLTAASITNIVQQKAVNDLVIALKGYSIWNKMKALYPVVGGTSARHAINLKTPGTYNLSFTAGWIHSSTGMLPNGTSDYANTSLNSLTNLTSTSNHLSFYSRSTSVGLECEIGNADTVTQKFFQLRAASNFASGGAGTAVNFTTTLDAKGFWIGSKRADNDREVYLNGISQSTITTNDTTVLFNGNVYISARNQASSSPPTALYSTKQCAFASIGDGLTDTEAANFYTAVQAFQTALGRQV